MIISDKNINPIKENDLDQVPSKILHRKFGLANDSIQLTILDSTNNVLNVIPNFGEYAPYYSADGNTITSIDFNYEGILRKYGYSRGIYKLNFSFQRKLLTSGVGKSFKISEISPTRTEIRFISKNLNSEGLLDKIRILISELNSPFVKNIKLLFGSRNEILITNAQADNESGLLKLYNPLPQEIGVGDTFRVYEDIIDPLEIEFDLGTPTPVDNRIDLAGPNFNIEVTDNYTIPSGFRTYDDILQNNAITSSFNNIQNYLSGSNIPVDLEFDNPNTPSGYTFENFIHYSSATERLKNFKYKLELLESYSSSLALLNNITGSVSESAPSLQNIEIFNNKTNKIIQDFDYYERYLYFESGTYAWPKTTIAKPHTNVKVNSAAAISWFGAPVDDFNNNFYGGQMLSASKFDDCNPYNLTQTIPPDIRDNPQNEAYVLFTEMIAQHFDGIWAYIDSITDKYQAHSGLNDGISKELVFNALTERGIRAYSQFENSNIYEYFLGDDGQGSFKYSTTDGSTMISASNAGSIPKGDISKEIWKRLYHNTPYLLKTKGTERGLKALIACYGVPETILHVKEYGGPLQDKTGFRTFSYQKESRMVNRIGNNDGGNKSSLVRIVAPFDKDPSTTLKPPTEELGLFSPTSLQVRYLPDLNNKNQLQPIFTISETNFADLPDLGVLISQSIDNSKLNSGSYAHLILVTGSSTENNINQNHVIKSQLVPFFNGDVWNISLTLDSGSSDVIKAYATNTNFNKNTYVATCSLHAPNYFATTDVENREIYVQPEGAELDFGANGALTHTVTGSFQEFRLYNETLSEATIITQSLSPFNYNGNTISSSFNALAVRIPFGSDLYTPGDSLGIALDLSNNINKAPDVNLINSNYSNSNLTIRPGKYIPIEETHHLTTPDTVGSAIASDKVRIDEGIFDDNFLDPFISVETSPQDRQPLDYSDVGVFLSPTFEINEDIIYTLGGFRLDDYIGDPTYYTSASYPALKTARDIYFQKVNREKFKFKDYIRTIQFFDHTLFKMIKDFVPAKANLKTGLVIEPHYLERTKLPGTNIDYEQISIKEANYIPTASISSINEKEHNVLINVHDYILSGSKATAVENVAQKSRISKFYRLR